jgi:YVTN family beta-propeller protein
MVKKKSARLSAMFLRINVLFLLNFFLTLMPSSVLNVYADTATGTVPAGTAPAGVAANPVTNKIYITNNNSSNVTVIDGATNSTATVPTGNSPGPVAVNPVTNKIYVANINGSSVTVIDGATNSTATVSTGTTPYGIAVNPITNNAINFCSCTGICSFCYKVE